MIDHLTSVVLDAVDERGLATPQDGETERVQARAVDDATVVAEMALGVDDRHVEPAVIGAKSGCPDDRADLPVAEVELQPRRPGNLRWREALGRRRSGSPRQPGPTRRRRPAAAPASGLRASTRFADRPRRAPGRHGGCPAADELDPHRGERVQVERRPLGRPDELRRRQPPGPCRDRPPRRSVDPRRRRRPSTRGRRGRDRFAAAGRARPPRASPAAPTASARPPAARRSRRRRRRERRRPGAVSGCDTRTP